MIGNMARMFTHTSPIQHQCAHKARKEKSQTNYKRRNKTVLFFLTLRTNKWEIRSQIGQPTKINHMYIY